jgi:hypothetical protein
MEEETLAGEEHRHAVLVCGIDAFLIAHRASRLNHRCHTYLVRGIDAITEWEEGV